MKLRKNRLIGLSLVIISIGFVFILLSFTNQLQEHAQASCSCVQEGQSCSMQAIPWQSYLGFSFLAIIFALGAYMLYKKEEKEVRLGINKQVLKQLDKDEKKIYNLIIDSQGTIFQSELVEKSGFSKVKVTRILDKLEGRQVIERKRRGMTNVVILK